MHFYEDFLAQYDPKLRKSRGVWYTPDAVVRFIVRAVDDILKTEFDLPDGLANASTVQIEVDTQNTDNRTTTGKRKEKRTVHRVQVGNYLGRNFGKILDIQEDRIDLREIVKDADGRWEERQASLALLEDE